MHLYFIQSAKFPCSVACLYTCLSNYQAGPIFIKLAEAKNSLKSQLLVSNLRPFLISVSLLFIKYSRLVFGLSFGLKVETEKVSTLMSTQQSDIYLF